VRSSRSRPAAVAVRHRLRHDGRGYGRAGGRGVGEAICDFALAAEPSHPERPLRSRADTAAANERHPVPLLWCDGNRSEMSTLDDEGLGGQCEVADRLPPAATRPPYPARRAAADRRHRDAAGRDRDDATIDPAAQKKAFEDASIRECRKRC